MNLLGAKLHDPGTAVSKSTASLIAMTALDTTNLRLTVTVPAHGMLCVRLRASTVGEVSSGPPAILLGVMEGATVRGRVQAQAGQLVTAATAANCSTSQTAEFTITGLTPGSITLDAAYAVQIVVASSNLKYGGANDTSGNDAWGGFVFEIWDPQPIATAGQLYVDANGRMDLIKVAGSTQTARDLGLALPAAAAGAAGGLWILGANAAANTTLTGVAASGATPATPALSLTGGAASTTAGGLAAQAIKASGGAGAASTNGAASGALLQGGGTNTVASTAHGLELNGKSDGSGLYGLGGLTGHGIKGEGGATGGVGIVGKGTGNNSGMNLQGNGTADGLTCIAGSTGVDIRGNLSGSVGSVTAAVAITSNVKKNQALNNFAFMMFDSVNHAPAPGKTVTVLRVIDSGTEGAGTLSAVTEIGNGRYRINFGSGDLNGNVITFRASATGCDDTIERIITQP